MKISFDIDDIIFRTFDKLAEVAWTYLNKDVSNPVSADVLGRLLTPSEIDFVLRKGLFDEAYDIQPIDASIQFVREYYQKFGNRVEFITSRPPWMINTTYTMLNQYLHDVDFIVYHVHSKRPKSHFINKCCSTIFVEDMMEYTWNIIENCPNIIVFLYSKSWNESYDIGDYDNIIRFDNWDTVRSYMEEL